MIYNFFSCAKLKKEDNQNQINNPIYLPNNNNIIFNNTNINNLPFYQYNTNYNINSNNSLNNSLTTNSNLNTNSSLNNSNNINYNNIGIINNNNINIKDDLQEKKKTFTSCSCPELMNLYNRNENIDFNQIQKGFKDVEAIYRSSCLNNIRDKWKISLQCNYYCNINQKELYNDIYAEYDGEHLKF